ncbi:MAG: serine--tRNA ligase, partial [Nanoarchaeota archaeon]
MIDLKFIRNNPDLVKENIKKKFQSSKLKLIDELLEKDELYRKYQIKIQELRHQRNTLSSEIGNLKRNGEDS